MRSVVWVIETTLRQIGPMSVDECQPTGREGGGRQRERKAGREKGSLQAPPRRLCLALAGSTFPPVT